MLGSIRFFLALLVLLSHVPNDGLHLNLGVVAVICFYFISGFLMVKSYTRFTHYSAHPIRDFYADRVIKLFPLYVIIVLLTFISLWFFGPSNEFWALKQEVTPLKVLLNLALLPVNYVFAPFAIEALAPHPIIPPAWSLATEFHFYLLLPLIVLLKQRYWLLLLIIVAAVQFSSFFFATGVFNSKVFGYNYIVGVLTIFLYGYAFAKREQRFYQAISLLIWSVFTLFLFICLPVFQLWQHTFVQEILIGGFMALPLGYYFTSVKTESVIIKQIDSFLGNLAYPIFISHMYAFYVSEKILLIPLSNMMEFYSHSLLICLAISLLLSLLQTRIDSWRINKRGFVSLKSNATTQ